MEQDLQPQQNRYHPAETSELELFGSLTGRGVSVYSAHVPLTERKSTKRSPAEIDRRRQLDCVRGKPSFSSTASANRLRAVRSKPTSMNLAVQRGRCVK